MPFQFGDDSFNPGDSTAVNCMISKGDLPLNVKWTLNGQPVVNGENGLQVVKMSSRLSSLSIESLSDRHRGVFRCIVSNGAGESTYSSELKINGRFMSRLHLKKIIIPPKFSSYSFKKVVPKNYVNLQFDHLLHHLILVKSQQIPEKWLVLHV